MERIVIAEKNFSDTISRAEAIIRSGGVVAVPTDTVYGLVGDATDKDAIKKIFVLKGRLKTKALPVFVKDVATARRFAYVSDKKAKILCRVWPGPVTAVFARKEKLPRMLTGDSDKIALRIPQGKFLSELLSRFDAPLVQTSANSSGSAPAKTAEEVIHYFGESRGGPDLLIDGGVCLGTASTVVDLSGEEPILLRAGRMDLEELQGAIRNLTT